MRHITEVPCGDARDLLGKLRELILEPPTGEPRPGRWAFRGQLNAEWKLIPSAFREGTELGYQNERFGKRTTGKDLQSYGQTQAEFNAVAEFLHLSDKVGLPVPGDTQLFRGNAEWQNVLGHSLGTDDWPPPEVLETLAIAQHHGVPTRLLDFTYSGEIAAYFAALEAIHQRRTEEGELAVWALDLDFLYVGTRLDRGARLVRVTVPRARNAFVHAQDGFFMYDSCVRHGDGASLDDAVEAIAESYSTNRMVFGELVPREWKPGFKFRLPWSCASELLRALRILGVDRAHLQPTYDNVVGMLRALRSEVAEVRPFPYVLPEPR